MKAYVYTLNGKVVINPEEMPVEESYTHYCDQGRYKSDFKKWESNCIEVENIVSMRGRERIKIGLLYYTISDITPGSQVEHDGPVITKIY